MRGWGDRPGPRSRVFGDLVGGPFAASDAGGGAVAWRSLAEYAFGYAATSG